MAALFHKQQRGISLVELMVGVAIGMIAVLVIMQVALTFEGQKRSTVGSAGAMDEGAVGLYALRREIQNAGYGISHPDLINCPIHGHGQLQQCKPSDPPPPPGASFNFRLLPIIITHGAGGTPDSIAINYSNASMLASSSMLQRKFEGDETAKTPEETRFKLKNVHGFAPGDVVVLGEDINNTTTGVDSAGNRLCSLYEVTGIVGDELEHNFTCYTKPIATQPDSSRFNKNGGLYAADLPSAPASSPIYPTGTKIFNLGQNPTSSLFSVENGNLVFRSQMGAANNIVLFENVISFQAQYGFDARPGSPLNMQIPAQSFVIGTGGYSDAIVDADGNATVGDAGDWLRMGAVRIAVVVRNKYPERPDPLTGKCNASNAAPAWSWGSVPEAAIDPLDTDEWKCYRYRTFESVIPLRNLYWRTQS